LSESFFKVQLQQVLHQFWHFSPTSLFKLHGELSKAKSNGIPYSFMDWADNFHARFLILAVGSFDIISGLSCCHVHLVEWMC